MVKDYPGLSNEAYDIMINVLDCENLNEVRKFYPNKSNEDLIAALNASAKEPGNELNLDLFFAGMKWQKKKGRK
jgi:hypothetical protein